ncbi:MAG: hydrolase [Bacteroidetes bacterium RIFCSPLOWO2_12_FULL_31_6]|nr:MAG: hydrolase [Bacteroidetes bacterium RIFCSPLOWO2_12_FULL_31_6]
MQFTFYGHACFAVEVEGKKLLFDPFISPNEKAKSIAVDAIAADYILVSHGHEDHLADVERIAKRTGAKVVSNFEIVTYFGKKGIENGHPMNHGGSWNFDFGTIKYVNAIHSSSFPDGSYAGNPGGFIVSSKDKTFYYSGDSALTMDMKLIGEYEKLDFAVFTIGDNFTMGVKDAIIASDFVKCNKIIGIHYDTFGYIEIDHKKAIADFKAKGKELILLEIGESLTM